MQERFNIAWFFAFEGMMSGAFSACSEIFKESNGWDEEDFGWIIFICVAAGIVAVPGVAKLCDRFGSSRVTLWSTFLLIVTTPFMAKFTAKETYFTLIMFVAMFGVLMATLDICINAQACCYEKLTGESHMGFMHALYAVGAVLGSLLAGLLIRSGYSFFQILSVIVIIGGVVSLFFLKIISKEEEEKLNAQSTGSEGNSQIEFEKLSAAASKLLKPLTDISIINMPTISSTANNNDTHHRDVELSLSHVGSSSTYEFLLVNEDEDSDREEEIVFNGKGGSDGSSVLNEGVSNFPSHKDPSQEGYTLLVALTLILCIAFLVEGSVGDWGAIFLTEECKVPPSSGLDAFGFAAFNIFVVLSRLLSDRSEGIISRSRLLQFCAAGSLVGFWLTALSPRFVLYHKNTGEPQEQGDYLVALIIALIGFSITGLALGPVSAIVIAASGNIKSIDSTTAVSTVSGISYFGLLAGPVLLGLIAQHSTLSLSFFVAGLLILIVYPLGSLIP